MDSLPALMQSQQAGTIRVDQTTRRLLPGRFVVGDADGVALLFAEAGGAGPERPHSVGGQVSPLVGRERELELLMSLRQECLRERVARAALVVGGSGIGKTRLAREFLAVAAEPPENIIRCTGTLVRPESDFGLLAPLLAAAGIPTAGTRGGRGQARFRALAARQEHRRCSHHCVGGFAVGGCGQRAGHGRGSGPFFGSAAAGVGLGSAGSGGMFSRLVGRAHGRVHPAGSPATQGGAKFAAHAGSPAAGRSRALRA